MTARLKFWGWGRESDCLSAHETAALESAYAKLFGVAGFEAVPVPSAEKIALRGARLDVPAALRGAVSTDHYERLHHSYGRSFFDSARIFSGDFSNPPDAVAFPGDEQALVDTLDWCDRLGAMVIPWGGGSSVVGGVTPPRSEKPIVTVDLRRLGQVLEIDTRSQAARIQAGTYGPSLEAQLRPSGLTLRHFPQSFEYSTLGGWIATRSGGHYATLHTHIDDFVESLRVVTPAGLLETFRLPGSGAGPSPDRLFIGSEGTLGVITEAWMRLRLRPTFRVSTAVRFADFGRAVDCVRAIGQSGLYPANARLLDAAEAQINGASDGRHAILVLGFESADRPQQAKLARALEISGEFDGSFDAQSAAADGAQRRGAAGQWRDAFLRMPLYREFLTPRAIIAETFETATTWDRFAELHSRVKSATESAIRAVTGRRGLVTCRFTHVYPDGPAPYFSFHALGDPGRLEAQCREIKSAAADVLNSLGGTITHHHAVGRDHRPWYDRQRPPLFAAALQAAKQTFDPGGIMNPGVLVDPRS